MSCVNVNRYIYILPITNIAVCSCVCVCVFFRFLYSSIFGRLAHGFIEINVRAKRILIADIVINIAYISHLQRGRVGDKLAGNKEKSERTNWKNQSKKHNAVKGKTINCKFLFGLYLLIHSSRVTNVLLSCSIIPNAFPTKYLDVHFT